MTKHDYATNLFNKDCSTYGTIANNGRARIEQTDDGRIYIFIDGQTYSANKDDLFGINENPVAWLDGFVKEFDKDKKKENFNAYFERRADEIEAKMEENSAEAKKSRKIQESIKGAIKEASQKLRNFLAECGVSNRFSLSGDKRVKAEKLNNDFWAQRFLYTSESNHEFSLLTDNCILVSEQGRAKQQIAFNNAMLERVTYDA